MPTVNARDGTVIEVTDIPDDAYLEPLNGFSDTWIIERDGEALLVIDHQDQFVVVTSFDGNEIPVTRDGIMALDVDPSDWASPVPA